MVAHGDDLPWRTGHGLEGPPLRFPDRGRGRDARPQCGLSGDLSTGIDAAAARADSRAAWSRARGPHGNRLYGNGPLAAVLWENGVLFAGIMAFLYADFVVIPSLRINARYYGWRFAGYLAMVFTTSAVAAGLVVHMLFSVLGLIPEARAGRVQEMAQFRIDYIFFLNLAAILLSGVLMWLAARSASAPGHNAAGTRRAAGERA